MACEQNSNRLLVVAVLAPRGSAAADAGRQRSRTTACDACVANGYRVDELMAVESRRMLVRSLDRIVCSSANYWTAMFSDLAAALGFLALGLRRFSGPWVVASGVVIAGFMSVGLLEYVVHRWVLHGPASMATRGHARHHAEPRA